jgi:DNA-binding Lrp family transcriptional regulator
MPTHQISENERRLFARLQSEADDIHTMVPIARIASDELPMHKEQAINLIRRWENEGLVTAYRGYTNVRLTELGLETTLRQH